MQSPQTAVKERPILFSGAMVRAILEGRKTQTRRVVRYPNLPTDAALFRMAYWGGTIGAEFDTREAKWSIRCPYGQPGDRLWVRETWQAFKADEEGPVCVAYRATCHDDNFNYVHSDGSVERIDILKWKPSIFLPRAASRILLEIVSVRVERLRDISQADAIAEGVTQRGKNYCMDWSPLGQPIGGVKHYDGRPALATESYLANDNARGAFATYFEKLNCSRSWEANPWVWVVEFKRVQPA